MVYYFQDKVSLDKLTFFVDKFAYFVRRSYNCESDKGVKTMDYRGYISKLRTIEMRQTLLGPDKDELKKAYRIVKELQTNCGVDVNSEMRLEPLRILSDMETSFENKMIVLNDFRELKAITEKNNAEMTLDNIVKLARQRLMLQQFGHVIEDYRKLRTINMCEVMSRCVLDVCNEVGVKAELKCINAGYTNQTDIFGGYGYHFVVIVYLQGERFLVDVSYSQFFGMDHNMIERLGICDILNCAPGLYMTMTEERLKVAKRILRDGWIELTDYNLKNYLDGFTLWYRNGLYYENTQDFSYIVPYTAYDYKRFLSGEDSLLNHENPEYIGYQRKPLKDPHLDFSRRL